LPITGASTVSSVAIFMIHNHPKLIVYLLGACLLGLALTGCAARSPVPERLPACQHPSVGNQIHAFWWAYRFKIDWPPDHEPDFAVDLLVAHAVVKPVLMEFESKIGLWRFHRRANRDHTGHQFTFLLYSDPETAEAVFRKIGNSGVLGEALAAGIVARTIMDNPATPERPRIEDTSDARWSPLLQRTWPYFIMGVSSLWLGLIDEALAEVPEGSSEIRALLERYRKAEARVISIWRDEGQHALLHHLNAIFGYTPVLIRKEMSF
jgi:hypothetical protein